MKSKFPIDIQSWPQYVGDQQGLHAFAYTIRITNKADIPVQLLSRHWVITHGDGQIEEVKGMGVVGDQPRLEPGESYTYTSGALLPTRVGTMQGAYQFVTEKGENFSADIPEFALLVPNAVH